MSPKQFAEERGWNRDTLLTLLEEFISDRDLNDAALEYLHGVAEVEDEMSEMDEDEDLPEDEEGDDE